MSIEDVAAKAESSLLAQQEQASRMFPLKQYWLKRLSVAEHHCNNSRTAQFPG